LGEPVTEVDHAIQTVSAKPLFVFHNGLNLNGIGPSFSSSSSKSKMGLWSEVSLGRMAVEISFLYNNKVLWTINLSNLADM
jgi:hypothetical protein